jgi:hypothetical protein
MLLLTRAAGAAWAAPPRSDAFATTQATVDSTDTEVANACEFSGLDPRTSEWYAFTRRSVGSERRC